MCRRDIGDSGALALDERKRIVGKVVTLLDSRKIDVPGVNPGLTRLAVENSAGFDKVEGAQASALRTKDVHSVALDFYFHLLSQQEFIAGLQALDLSGCRHASFSRPRRVAPRPRRGCASFPTWTGKRLGYGDVSILP